MFNVREFNVWSGIKCLLRSIGRRERTCPHLDGQTERLGDGFYVLSTIPNLNDERLNTPAFYIKWFFR